HGLPFPIWFKRRVNNLKARAYDHGLRTLQAQESVTLFIPNAPAARPPNPFARTQEHRLRSICLASIHSQCLSFLAETDMRQMQTHAQSTSNDSQTKRAYPFNDHKLSHTLDSVPMNTLPMYRSPSPSIRGSQMSILAGSGELGAIQHDWDVSLTQRGIRIDTNIASIPDLYNILLKGVSMLRIDSNFPPKSRGSFDSDLPASLPSSSTDPGAESAVVVCNYPFWIPPTLSFPLYNPWESESILPTGPEEQLPPELIDSLIDCFFSCILALQLPDKQDFMAQYRSKTLDPLVLNASLSWAARHAAIYHNMFPGKDPNVVGEQFFTRAKKLLRDRVFLSKPTTIHALLIMYLYQVGKMGPTRDETQSEAYLYLGMANRMILDQKMHLPKRELDEVTQELFRRFFWVGYFLELLASAHMDKPSVIPEREVIRIPGCQPMAHEDEEAQLKVEFCFHRHRLALIYRDVSLNLTRKEPLLSAVSSLDRRLNTWYNELPSYFRWQFNSQRDFHTHSFREQGCLKLVTDYHFCQLQLYRPFLAKPREPPSTIAILSHDKCVKSATAISSILVFYTHLKTEWCHFTVDSFPARRGLAAVAD
ncbi:hypothetical protein BC937DRAFT_90105, partial [Endogone sp. FLAS-F59071]